MNLNHVAKKRYKVPGFAHVSHVTFVNTDISGNVTRTRTFSWFVLALCNSMGAMDLAVCLSLTYVFLLTSCSHRYPLD